MRGRIVKRQYKNKKGELVESPNWSVILDLPPSPDGKRKQKCVVVKGGYHQAEKRLAEMVHSVNTGEYTTPAKITVASFLKRWLEDYALPNLTPRSYERYAGICNVHLVPAFGNVALTQLKVSHVQELYSCMTKAGLAPRTVRYVHVVLHKALVTAIKWGMVSRNASDGAEVPRPRRGEMLTWNESEISTFLEAARSTPYYALFYTALFTGARRSELLALRWQDVDFIYSQIYINRTIHQLGNKEYVFQSPKSEKGRRTIALSPSAFLVLQEYQKQKEAEALMFDTSLKDDDLVFSTMNKPLRPNTVSRAWELLAVKAGVKVIRFHDARHTHASLMLKQNIHPRIVQERLGHSTISITLDTYSHVAPGLQEAAAKRFDDIVQIRHNETVKNSVSKM